MKLIGISRETVLFDNATVARSKKTRYSFDQLEVGVDVFLLALLEEEPLEKHRFGGALIVLFGQETETPRLWYGTGNPFKLHERWGMPVLVRSAPSPTSLPLRRFPIVDSLANLYGYGPELVPKDPLLRGLRRIDRPQQRWIDAPWGIIAETLKRDVGPFGEIDAGSEVPRATETSAPRLYLYAADGLRHWVKVGSAAKSATARLQSQQLCNPRPLGHLAVWRTDAVNQSELDSFESQLIERLPAPVLDLSRLRRDSPKRRFQKEWLLLDWNVALDRLSQLAAVMAWTRES